MSVRRPQKVVPRTRGRREQRTGFAKTFPGRARGWQARVRGLVDRALERSARRAHRSPGVTLIGLDVSRPPLRLQTRSWIPAAAALLVGALFLAALRMDVTRMRLTLGEAFKEEIRLQEVERELTVDMRRLRDPALLARLAAERGFQRADRLIDLRDPARVGRDDGAAGSGTATSRLASARSARERR